MLDPITQLGVLDRYDRVADADIGPLGGSDAGRDRRLDVVHGASPAANDQSPSPQTEELSPSELRVLRYLPTNLSRPEIASELSVSVNTVNTHVRSIYAKLQARDRSSAVQRARALRLLSAGRIR